MLIMKFLLSLMCMAITVDPCLPTSHHYFRQGCAAHMRQQTGLETTDGHRDVKEFCLVCDAAHATAMIDIAGIRRTVLVLRGGSNDREDDPYADDLSMGSQSSVAEGADSDQSNGQRGEDSGQEMDVGQDEEEPEVQRMAAELTAGFHDRSHPVFDNAKDVSGESEEDVRGSMKEGANGRKSAEQEAESKKASEEVALKLIDRWNWAQQGKWNAENTDAVMDKMCYPGLTTRLGDFIEPAYPSQMDNPQAVRPAPPKLEGMYKAPHSQNATQADKRFWIAVRAGRLPEVQRWIAQGVGIHKTDFSGQTPLHMAAARGHVDIVALLLQHGASVTATTIWRGTPLHSAAEWGRAAVAQQLLEAGADVDAADENQRTPLHVATELPCPPDVLLGGGDAQATVKVLLDAGAEVFVKDITGNTPRDYCSDYPFSLSDGCPSTTRGQPYAAQNDTRKLYPEPSLEEVEYYRARGPPAGITYKTGPDGMDPEEAEGLPMSWQDIAKPPTPAHPLRRTFPFTPSPPPGATDDEIDQVGYKMQKEAAGSENFQDPFGETGAAGEDGKLSASERKELLGGGWPVHVKDGEEGEFRVGLPGEAQPGVKPITGEDGTEEDGWSDAADGQGSTRGREQEESGDGSGEEGEGEWGVDRRAAVLAAMKGMGDKETWRGQARIQSLFDQLPPVPAKDASVWSMEDPDEFLKHIPKVSDLKAVYKKRGMDDASD